MTRYYISNPATGSALDVIPRDGIHVVLASGETTSVDEATYRWLLRTYGFLTGQEIEEPEVEVPEVAVEPAKEEIEAESMSKKKKEKKYKRKGR